MRNERTWSLQERLEEFCWADVSKLFKTTSNDFSRKSVRPILKIGLSVKTKTTADNNTTILKVEALKWKATWLIYSDLSTQFFCWISFPTKFSQLFRSWFQVMVSLDDGFTSDAGATRYETTGGPLQFVTLDSFWQGGNPWCKVEFPQLGQVKPKLFFFVVWKFVGLSFWWISWKSLMFELKLWMKTLWKEQIVWRFGVDLLKLLFFHKFGDHPWGCSPLFERVAGLYQDRCHWWTKPG